MVILIRVLQMKKKQNTPCCRRSSSVLPCLLRPLSSLLRICAMQAPSACTSG